MRPATALKIGLLASALSTTGCRQKPRKPAADSTDPASVIASSDPKSMVSHTQPMSGDPHSRERLEQLVMVQQEGGAAFKSHETHSQPITGLGTAIGVQLSLRNLASSHTMEARSLLMTSEDLFVRVGVLLSNTGKDPQKLDLRFAQLQTPQGSVPISRSAELAEPRPLQFEIAPGEKAERTLYFEMPDSALKPNLFLVLPQGALGAAEFKMGIL